MKSQKNTIKQLANYFDQELQAKLPINVLPNGSLVYKDFLVKQLPNSNWGVFNLKNKDLINQYYLKSCALMAAKSYSHKLFNKCNQIKELDNSYWSNYSDTVVFKHNINKVSDDKYHILLTRLEESSYQAEVFKKKIYSLFKYTFV